MLRVLGFRAKPHLPYYVSGQNIEVGKDNGSYYGHIQRGYTGAYGEVQRAL